MILIRAVLVVPLVTPDAQAREVPTAVPSAQAPAEVQGARRELIQANGQLTKPLERWR
jgi:hypothetical protein